MKNKMWFMFILFSILAFSGCDEGLKYKSIEIIKYPSKIIYYIGVDKELDLSDGMIKLATYAGTTRIFGMDEESDGGNREFIIKHSVDFSLEGYYTVEIRRTSELSVSITIQVVDPKSG